MDIDGNMRAENGNINVTKKKNWRTSWKLNRNFSFYHQYEYALARVIKCKILIRFITFSSRIQFTRFVRLWVLIFVS